MKNSFANMDEENENLPEHIKKSLFAEVDVIRDSLNVANMFMGQFMQTAVTMLQETQPQNKKTFEE